jgi:hypothetical protein
MFVNLFTLNRTPDTQWPEAIHAEGYAKRVQPIELQTGNGDGKI